MSIYAKIYITAFVVLLCSTAGLHVVDGKAQNVLALVWLISVLLYPVTFIAWVWLET